MLKRINKVLYVDFKARKKSSKQEVMYRSVILEAYAKDPIFAYLDDLQPNVGQTKYMKNLTSAEQYFITKHEAGISNELINQGTSPDLLEVKTNMILDILWKREEGKPLLEEPKNYTPQTEGGLKARESFKFSEKESENEK